MKKNERVINKLFLRSRRRKAAHIRGIKDTTGKYIITADGKVLYKSGS